MSVRYSGAYTPPAVIPSPTSAAGSSSASSPEKGWYDTLRSLERRLSASAWDAHRQVFSIVRPVSPAVKT